MGCYLQKLWISESAAWKRSALLLFCLSACCGVPAAPVCQPDSNSTGTVVPAEAPSAPEKKKKRGNIFVRFFKNFNDYDTTYIEPQHYNFAAMVQNTNTFQSYHLSARDESGHRQSLSMRPAPSLKVGPYFGWRWIFLGYTFDVAHLGNPAKQSEFNLSLYSAMLGLDLLYVKNSGNFKLGNTHGFEGIGKHDFKGYAFDGLDTYTASASAYYVFNHRRFSYPAAFSQSTVQRKSCGSWLLGARYDRQHMEFDYTQLPAGLIGSPGHELIMDELKWNKIDYRAFSVCGGYAYNWVFAPGWLLGISAMPAIGFKVAKGKRLRGDELFVSLKNLNFDCISRLGIVWNNTRCFAGLSLVAHMYNYTKGRLTLTNGMNYLNLYVGFNFNKKKEYRRKK